MSRREYILIRCVSSMFFFIFDVKQNKQWFTSIHFGQYIQMLKVYKYISAFIYTCLKKARGSLWRHGHKCGEVKHVL